MYVLSLPETKPTILNARDQTECTTFEETRTTKLYYRSYTVEDMKYLAMANLISNMSII